MDLRNVAQLESLGNEVVAGIRALGWSPSSSAGCHSLLNGPESEQKTREARVRILSSLSAIRALVCGPTDFLEHLTIQCEILTCLRWLGEFQILACIPLSQSVPIKDVADLSAVPLRQLTRIIRLAATAGFLCVPEPNQVAHTALSESFIANPALHDAAMFLAESVATAALQAAPATRRFGDSRVASETAFNLVMNNATSPFRAVQERNPKIGRQWAAFLQYSAGIPSDEDVVGALAQLNWSSIAHMGGKIVEIGGCKLTPLLASMHPKLHFIVQHTENGAGDAANSLDSHKPQYDPQVTVTSRVPGTQQIRTDAAVYVLHPATSPSEFHAELQVHLPVLRMTNSSLIIVTTQVLPEVGGVELSTNGAIALARDLVLHQLANEEDLDMPVLLDMIDTIRDVAGRMVVVHTLRSRSNLIVALVVKYQLFTGADS